MIQVAVWGEDVNRIVVAVGVKDDRIQATVGVMGDQRIPSAIEVGAKRIRAAVGVEDLSSSRGRQWN